MAKPNYDLRAQLQHITETGPIEHHPKLIQELALRIPHSIEYVPDLRPNIPIDTYNCFEFAFGVAGYREVNLISQSFRYTCLSSHFLEYLVTLGLVPAASAYSEGSVVFYRDGRSFTHAGRVHGGQVISKWGPGHVWLHDVLEVPQNYGDLFSFHVALNPDVMLDAFVNFACQREGTEIVAAVLGR